MYYYVLYVFLHLSLFFCYNMNLYFGPAALHYIINNILSYLILFSTWTSYAVSYLLSSLVRPTSKRLTGPRFLPVKAVPVDLFPHTTHCEMVLLFEREKEETDDTDWGVKSAFVQMEFWLNELNMNYVFTSDNNTNPRTHTHAHTHTRTHTHTHTHIHRVLWGYLGITMAISMSVHMSCKRNSSLKKETILMKLYTVVVYDLRMKERQSLCELQGR